VDARGYEDLGECYRRWPIEAALTADQDRLLCQKAAHYARRLKDFRGRRAETAQLENALGTPGAAVMLRGEPGVGKTLFLWHLCMRDFRKRIVVETNPFEESAGVWLQDLAEALSKSVADFDPRLLHVAGDGLKSDRFEPSLHRALQVAIPPLVSAGFDTLLFELKHDSPDVRALLGALMHAAKSAGLKLVVACRSETAASLGGITGWTTQVELPSMSWADVRSRIEEMLLHRPHALRRSVDSSMKLFDGDRPPTPNQAADVLRVFETLLDDRRTT
jgi:hypothetical protein